MPPPVPRRKLPVNPSLEHLQKQAKRRAKQSPSLQLAAAQHQIAQEYGCKNWAELAHVVETMSRGADQLVAVKKKVEPLPQAARRRDLEEVRRILECGSYTPHDLDAALGAAVCYGSAANWEIRKTICDLLLSYGADPDGQWGSAYGPIVFGTGECVQPEGLEYLLAAGADVSFPPIETKYGSHCPLSLILGTYARGTNDRKHRYLDILLAHRPFVPAEVTPPVLALHRGRAQELGECLDRDPSLTHRRIPGLPYGNIALRGATLLHCAVEFGEHECIEELVRRGADLNARAEPIDGIGDQTPLFHAIAMPSTLRFLLDRFGDALDLSLAATLRRHGKILTPAMTPLQFAEHIARETDDGQTRPADEIALLRELAARRGGG